MIRRYAEWEETPEVPRNWMQRCRDHFGTSAGVMNLLDAFNAMLFCLVWSRSPVLAAGVLAAGVIAKPFVHQLHLAPSWLARRMDLPSEGRQFPVMLTCLSDMFGPYGQDHGIVVFEDGWLVFTGRTCTFEVRVGDLTQVTRDQTFRSLKLDWQLDGETHHAILEPYNLVLVRGFRLGRLRKAFMRASCRWLEEGKLPGGSALYPPISPDFRAREARWRPGVARIALVGSLLSTLGFALPVAKPYHVVWVMAGWIATATLVMTRFNNKHMKSAQEMLDWVDRHELGQTTDSSTVPFDEKVLQIELGPVLD